MCRVFRWLAQIRRRRVDEIDRRIIGRDQRVGRIPRDLGKEPAAGREELGKRRAWKRLRWSFFLPRPLPRLAGGLPDRGLLRGGRFLLAAVRDLERVLRRTVEVLIDEFRLHARPPAVVELGEAADHVRVAIGHVPRLARIGGNVVEFPAVGAVGDVDEAPTAFANADVRELARRRLPAIPTPLMRHERPVGPLGGRVAEQGHEAAALNLRRDLWRDLDAGDLAERRQHVEMGGHRRHIDALRQRSLPPPERRHPRASPPDGALRPAHPGVKDARTVGCAVIGREHHERVPGHAEPFKFGEQSADVRIDVLDHAVELRDLGPLLRVAHARLLKQVEVHPIRAHRTVER